MFAVQPGADAHGDHAQNHETGRNNISEQAHVGIAVMGEKVDEEKENEGNEPANGNNQANEAQPIPEPIWEAGGVRLVGHNRHLKQDTNPVCRNSVPPSQPTSTYFLNFRMCAINS